VNRKCDSRSPLNGLKNPLCLKITSFPIKTVLFCTFSSSIHLRRLLIFLFHFIQGGSNMTGTVCV